jgi:protein HIRA/HIR1
MHDNHDCTPILTYHPHTGDLKDFEVYSCHVSPDGTRLVTAAGGTTIHYCGAHARCAATKSNANGPFTDGYVRIWSTEAILNSADPEYTKPKQLAAVSHHSGTIHAVRFSSNGKYLASGADDKIVCVYALDPNAPTHAAFGGYWI